MALTVKRIARLKSRPGRYLDQHGLYLNIRGENNQSWLYRYMRDGVEHWAGIGPLHTIDLPMARERARAMRVLLLDGRDPLEERRKEKAARALEAAKSMTFKQCAEEYIDQNESGWKNRKHATQWVSTLQTYVFPKIGNLPVNAIDTGLVLRVLEQRVEAGLGSPAGTLWATRQVTAMRVRGRIESVLAWATVRGFRQGDNPAARKNHLQHALADKGKAAKVNHHAALPYAQIPEFMQALRAQEGIAARCLEFVILTSARTQAALGAKWDEINLDSGTWTVPAERMKAGKAHKVPLAPAVVELLKALPREAGNGFCFVGARPGAALSHMALANVLRRMGRSNGATVHGFRSTFMDFCHDRTAFPKTVIDMALAHTVSDKVEAAYRRGDLFKKRAALMEQWAKYCASTPAAATEANVIVPIRS
jgi:integrase